MNNTSVNWVSALKDRFLKNIRSTVGWTHGCVTEDVNYNLMFDCVMGLVPPIQVVPGSTIKVSSPIDKKSYILYNKNVLKYYISWHNKCIKISQNILQNKNRVSILISGTNHILPNTNQKPRSHWRFSTHSPHPSKSHFYSALEVIPHCLNLNSPNYKSDHCSPSLAPMNHLLSRVPTWHKGATVILF